MSRRPSSEKQLALVLAVISGLRRMGAPIWGVIPIVVVLLVGVLMWPTIEQRLGLPGELPTAGETSPIEQPTPPTPERGADRGNAETPELAGFFTEVRPQVYESPAGLRYRPGSSQGHRLKHVMAHASDQPKRAGPHGVFDDHDPVAVYQLIDEAYEYALAGKRTETRREDNRTLYTVDFGERIGFVGGETGNARGRPAARRLRLILEGQYVITAYPVR